MNEPTTCPHCHSPKARDGDLVWSCGTFADALAGRPHSECRDRELAVKERELNQWKEGVERLQQCLTDIAPTLSGGQGGWTTDSIREWAFAQFREMSELRAEAANWKTAALRTGLYKSDTDVSTPGAWHAAQAAAACRLLEIIEKQAAELAKLRAIMKKWDVAISRQALDTQIVGVVHDLILETNNALK